MDGTARTRPTGAVTGGVRILLRLEGLTLFRRHDAALCGLGRLVVGLRAPVPRARI